jgi:putative DNA primase/helicase
VLPTLILDTLRADGVKGLGQGTKLIEQYIFNVADVNRYNPIREMLEKYDNDDEGNLTALIGMLGIENEFDITLVKKWFIQCVALAYSDVDNPVSSEGVLVLQGAQGCGKTSFFRRMALRPEWFTEGAVIDVRNKDSLITALSTWICELGEIDCTLKREQSALKAFITRPLDRIRFPYAPAESELARSTSLCGTVNPDRFLNDLTGARRYWVISVDSIDKKQLFETDDDVIKNIWCYFYHLYKDAPNSFRLTDSERVIFENENRVYNFELKYESELLYLLDFTLE